MLQRRLQILAEREDVAARRAQIRIAQHFFFRFAQAEHHAGLRVNGIAALLLHLFQTLKLNGRKSRDAARSASGAGRFPDCD
jgi:hypothetical protein